MKRIAVLPLAFFVFAISSLGQEATRYTQGDVNQSATMSIGVPMGSYKGRGIDLPVSLSYSSSVWSIESLARVHTAGSIPQSVTQAIYSKFAVAGWKSSLDLPIIEFPSSDNKFAYDGKPTLVGGGDGCFGNRIAKVFIHMPDGSTHELRKSDVPYISGSIDTSGDFYAVDGSRLRFNATGSDTGTLYMPDGTRYVLGGSSSSSYIIDRNGNTLTYNPSNRTWTDTIGRTITNPIPANPTAGTTTYCNLPGLSGVSPSGYQTYALVWANLSDVLTPDDNNVTPTRKYIADKYLPSPSSFPTNEGSSNYPQAQPTPNNSLFTSEYNLDENGDQVAVPTLVVGKAQSSNTLFNTVVLKEIDLPDGTKYQFSYNIYGEIDKVIYPTNAYEKYVYGTSTPSTDWETSYPYSEAKRIVTSRKLSAKGDGSDTLEWQYSDSAGGSYRTVSTIAPDKTRTEVTLYDFTNGLAKFGYQAVLNGNVVQKRQYSTSTDGHGGSLLRRELFDYDQTIDSFTYNVNCGAGPQYHIPVTATRNPRMTKSVSILFEGSGSALAQTNTFSYDTTYEYSTGLDQTQANVYNYAVISNTSVSDTAQAGTINDISVGSLAKYTVSIFLNTSTYRDANILGLPATVEVRDSADTIASRSEMSYDDSGYVATGTTNALPTTSKTWDSTKGIVTNTSAYLVTHATFDSLRQSHGCDRRLGKFDDYYVRFDLPRVSN